MRKYSILASVIASILLSTPIILACQKSRARKYVIVPSWRIQVVDEDGKPIKGARVRESWEDYDIENSRGEQLLFSDERGYVEFPERAIRTTDKERLRVRLENKRKYGIHASSGPTALIVSWTEELEGSVKYVPGEPLPTRVVMQKRIEPDNLK